MSIIPDALASVLTPRCRGWHKHIPRLMSTYQQMVSQMCFAQLSTHYCTTEKDETEKSRKDLSHGTGGLLKQTTRKLERKWHPTKLELFCLAWMDSLAIYEKALSDAKSSYYSSLIEKHKNNLFSSLASLD